MIWLQEGTKFAGIFSDNYIARVAQLVEPHVANVAVAGSNPVSRSLNKPLISFRGILLSDYPF